MDLNWYTGEKISVMADPKFPPSALQNQSLRAIC